MDSISRFNNRVENYTKYRPNYPEDIIDFLTEEKVLNSCSIIADIGSGTGKLTELFLKYGNEVFGIEPNDEMRLAAEKLLKKYNNFHSINSKAEDTKLSGNSVDLISAGQSFHWFYNEKSKLEFKKILKKDGYVVLVWNDRCKNSSGFMKAFDKLLSNLESDYKEVKHDNLKDKDFTKFFGTGKYKIKSFNNFQLFDYKSLEGRLLSTSYTPTDGKAFTNMINELRVIFKTYNVGGKIRIDYKTKIYYSKMI